MNTTNTNSTANPEKTKSCTIMMVDSDLPTLKLAEKHFTSKGFKSIPVQDPHTILKLIRTGKPEIIIMGIALGKISGKNRLQRNRKAYRGPFHLRDNP